MTDVRKQHAVDFDKKTEAIVGPELDRSPELAADLFTSFDDDQVKLAKAAGLKALRPG